MANILSICMHLPGMKGAVVVVCMWCFSSLIMSLLNKDLDLLRKGACAGG